MGLVLGSPDPRLAPYVRRYAGYAEAGPPVRRRELPSGDVALIVSFGPEIAVARPGGAEERHVSFVAGVDDAPALTSHAGRQAGVQLDVSPLVARMLLGGTPMDELARRVVPLEALLGPAAGVLAERLHAAPSWAERFALLDAFVARRLASARRPPPEVVLAWRRLVATGGAVPVAELAAEAGWSRRHLAARFREHVGLPPKALARVLRFRRAVELLRRDDGTRFAEIAAACGYADQPHMNRDFRALAGAPPGALLPFVQDAGAVAA